MVLTIIINKRSVVDMTRRSRPLTRRLRTSLAGGVTVAAGGPAIVATTTQVGDFTRQLLGDSAEVTQLLAAGQSAHGFDPSAAQLLALTEADALVVNGAGLESWLDDAVQ